MPGGCVTCPDYCPARPLAVKELKPGGAGRVSECPAGLILFLRLIPFFYSRSFNIILLIIGISLRLKHFLENRSLRLDEASMVLGMMMRSSSEIFNFSRYNPQLPTAPIGFLLLEKGLIQFFSNNEFVLRLFPFICSILSLFLVHKLLTRYITPRAIPIALGLFIFSEPLIFYAADVKVYSCDVLISIVLILIVDHIKKYSFNRVRILLFGLAGALSLWFSYISIFVLASVGMWILVLTARKGKLGKLMILLGCMLFWGGSFSYVYFRQIINISKNSGLYGMWDQAFMPWSAGLLESLYWLNNALLSMFQSTLGIPSVLGGILFFLGGISIWKRKREQFFLFMTPLFVTLLASIVHKYPFEGRLVLFLAPSLIIFISEGFLFFMSRIKGFPLHLIIGSILLSVLFYQPVATAAFYLSHSHDKEQIRPVMSFLKKNVQEGDSFYMNNSAVFGFVYYQDSLDFPQRFKRIGRTYDKFYVENGRALTEIRYENHIYNKDGVFLGIGFNKKSQEVYPIYEDQWFRDDDNKRTWILLAHFKPELRRVILGALDAQGKRLMAYEKRGAAIYLYDLSQ